MPRLASVGVCLLSEHAASWASSQTIFLSELDPLGQFYQSCEIDSGQKQWQLILEYVSFLAIIACIILYPIYMTGLGHLRRIPKAHVF